MISHDKNAVPILNQPNDDHAGKVGVFVSRAHAEEIGEIATIGGWFKRTTKDDENLSKTAVRTGTVEVILRWAGLWINGVLEKGGRGVTKLVWKLEIWRKIPSMNRQDHQRHLMERIRDAHTEFSRVWNGVRATELRKRGFDSTDQLIKRSQYEEIWLANEVAYKVAQPYADVRNQFSATLYDVIPFQEFDGGDSEAIDAVIDFLEIDVLAFRCGYVKQECLHKLKSLPLNESRLHGCAG